METRAKTSSVWVRFLIRKGSMGLELGALAQE
jgi:hypothetical protein